MKKIAVMVLVGLMMVGVAMATDYPVTPKDVGVRMTGFNVVEAVPDLTTSTWTVSLSVTWTGLPSASSNDVDIVGGCLAMDLNIVCTKAQIEVATGKDYDALTIAELRTTVIGLAKTRVATRFNVVFQ
jgi:hypothetical protein